jgi:hypothetical protein
MAGEQHQLGSGLLLDVTDTGHGIANPAAELAEAEVVAALEGRQALSRSSSLGQDPDHIEVSLDEGAGNPVEEVLNRAAGFFAGHNDNYSVSWEEASRKITDVEEDPSRPPVPGLFLRDSTTQKLGVNKVRPSRHQG